MPVLRVLLELGFRGRAHELLHAHAAFDVHRLGVGSQLRPLGPSCLCTAAPPPPWVPHCSAARGDAASGRRAASSKRRSSQGTRRWGGLGLMKDGTTWSSTGPWTSDRAQLARTKGGRARTHTHLLLLVFLPRHRGLLCVASPHLVEMCESGCGHSPGAPDLQHPRHRTCQSRADPDHSGGGGHWWPHGTPPSVTALPRGVLCLCSRRWGSPSSAPCDDAGPSWHGAPAVSAGRHAFAERRNIAHAAIESRRHGIASALSKARARCPSPDAISEGGAERAPKIERHNRTRHQPPRTPNCTSMDPTGRERCAAIIRRRALARRKEGGLQGRRRRRRVVGAGGASWRCRGQSVYLVVGVKDRTHHGRGAPL